jgi:hypothetical protein
MNDVPAGEPFNFIAYLDPNDYPDMNITTEGEVTVNSFEKFDEFGTWKYAGQVQGNTSETQGKIIMTSTQYPTVKKEINFNFI